MNSAMQIDGVFDVNEDRIRAGLGKSVEIAIRLFNHEMGFKRQLGDWANRLDDNRPHADIRHEMAVHDIDMNAISAGLVRFTNLFAEAGEVGGEDGGGEFDHWHCHKRISETPCDG